MSYGFRRILVAVDLEAPSSHVLSRACEIARAAEAALGVVAAVPGPAPVATRAEAEADLASRVHAAAGLDESAYALFVDAMPVGAAIVERARTFGADLIVLDRAVREDGRHLDGIALDVVRHAPCSVLIAREPTADGPVLIAVDLGKSSTTVVRTGAELARALGKEAIVTHVAHVDSPDIVVALTAFFSGSLPPQPDVEAVLALAKAALEAEIAAAGLQAEARIVRGEPKHAVLEQAQIVEAATIVVGSTTHPTLARLGLGSVAETVVQKSAASVLVVRPSR